MSSFLSHRRQRMLELHELFPPHMSDGALPMEHFETEMAEVTAAAASRATSAAMSSPALLRRHEDEVWYCEDILQRLAAHGNPCGFDEDLYVSCQRFLTFFSDDVVRSKRLWAKRKAAAESHHSTMDWGRAVTVFLESPSSGNGALAFYVFISLVCFLSCTCAVLETLPQYNPMLAPQYDFLWMSLDLGVVLVLLLEFLVRLLIAVYDTHVPSSKWQNLIRFLSRAGNALDLFYMFPSALRPMIAPGSRFGKGILRTMTLTRSFKFLRHFDPVWGIARALLASMPSLTAPLLFLVTMLLLFSSTLFFLERGTFNPVAGEYEVFQDPYCNEQPRAFLSLSLRAPHVNVSLLSAEEVAAQNVTCLKERSRFITVAQSLWCGIVTMTTVGFGDFVPKTGLGKVVAVLAIAVGLAIIAMPIAVIDTNYLTILEAKRSEVQEMRQQTDEEELHRRRGVARESTEVSSAGERIISALKELTQLQVLDLAAPGPLVLHLLDALLESAVCQVVNQHLHGLNVPLRFSSSRVTSLPLWTCLTCTSTDSDPSVAAFATSSRVEVATVLSRPHVLTLGCQGPGAACGVAEPECPIMEQSLADLFELHRRHLEHLAATNNIPMETACVPPPCNFSTISQQHATLVVFRVWGCTFCALQSLSPSCSVVVYRAKGDSSALESNLQYTTLSRSVCTPWKGSACCAPQVSPSGSKKNKKLGRRESILQARTTMTSLTTTGNDRLEFREADETSSKPNLQQVTNARSTAPDLHSLIANLTTTPRNSKDNTYPQKNSASFASSSTLLESSADGALDAPHIFDHDQFHYSLSTECRYFLLEPGDVIQFGGAKGETFESVLQTLPAAETSMDSLSRILTSTASHVVFYQFH